MMDGGGEGRRLNSKKRNKFQEGIGHYTDQTGQNTPFKKRKQMGKL